MPVILGGEPLLQRPLPIVRPSFPPLFLVADRLGRAMAAGQMTNGGPYVQEFEARLASYLGVRHAVAVSNATVGLALLLRALRELDGDGARNQVVLPSFTFSASAHAVVWAGLTPVFADILPDTYTLDPAATEAALSELTLAIMGVHVFGHPCEIEALDALAAHHGVTVVYDSAHAIGTRHRGTLMGRFGRAEVFSFHATKVLPVGEGGAVATDDDVLAQRVRLLRQFGDPGDGRTRVVGLNGKMQEFNALVGIESLARVEEHVAHRRQVARLLRARLGRLAGVELQAERPTASSNVQNFSICVNASQLGLDRDGMFVALRAEQVLCRKYFWPPVHAHPSYVAREARGSGDLPRTERVSSRVLCLPLYSDMTDAEASVMCDAIERVVQHAGAIRRHLVGAASSRKDVEAASGSSR